MDLDPTVLERILQRALRDGGDFADLFAEDRLYEGVSAHDGQVDSLQTGIQRGVGIRVVRGDTTALVSVEILTEEALLEASAMAASIARATSGRTVVPLAPQVVPVRSEVKILPRDVAKEEKVDAVLRAGNFARSVDHAIRRVTVYSVDSQQDIIVANSDGLLVRDRRCRVRFMVQVTAERDGRSATGTAAPGATSGFEFIREQRVEDIANEAAQQALTFLDAQPSPAGEMPVILAPGIGGILFHEVAGHGLEGDAVAKYGSPYRSKLGERVASPIVSAADDATIWGGWSSYGVDDEGTEGKRTQLIEEGILRSYILDRVSGRQLGMTSTGNARRSSFRHLPLPRMSNTYIQPGPSSPEEIIAGTDSGLYASFVTGGSVDPATGNFNFSVNCGYLIRHGKLAAPVRDVLIMGNALDVLMSIDAVANDLKLLAASCQKEGGRVSVGIGQPTVRVRSLQVAGRG